jgi:hypothetical protein
MVIVNTHNSQVCICQHKCHIHIQTGYFNEYLITTSDNVEFYAGIISYFET